METENLEEKILEAVKSCDIEEFRNLIKSNQDYFAKNDEFNGYLIGILTGEMTRIDYCIMLCILADNGLYDCERGYCGIEQVENVPENDEISTYEKTFYKYKKQFAKEKHNKNLEYLFLEKIISETLSAGNMEELINLIKSNKKFFLSSEQNKSIIDKIVIPSLKKINENNCEVYYVLVNCGLYNVEVASSASTRPGRKSNLIWKKFSLYKNYYYDKLYKYFINGDENEFKNLFSNIKHIEECKDLQDRFVESIKDYVEENELMASQCNMLKFLLERGIENDSFTRKIDEVKIKNTAKNLKGDKNRLNILPSKLPSIPNLNKDKNDNGEISFNGGKAVQLLFKLGDLTSVIEEISPLPCNNQQTLTCCCKKINDKTTGKQARIFIPNVRQQTTMKKLFS